MNRNYNNAYKLLYLLLNDNKYLGIKFNRWIKMWGYKHNMYKLIVIKSIIYKFY